MLIMNSMMNSKEKAKPIIKESLEAGKNNKN